MASYKSVVMLSLCCAAQTVFADFCSDQKGIENFNFTAFQGVWYFAYKYGTRISVSFGDACVKSDHTRTKNGFEVFLEYYDSKKKKQSFAADVPLMKEGGSYFEVNSKEQIESQTGNNIGDEDDCLEDFDDQLELERFIESKDEEMPSKRQKLMNN